jgi:hypothetical protein
MWKLMFGLVVALAVAGLSGGNIVQAQTAGSPMPLITSNGTQIGTATVSANTGANTLQAAVTLSDATPNSVYVVCFTDPTVFQLTGACGATEMTAPSTCMVNDFVSTACTPAQPAGTIATDAKGNGQGTFTYGNLAATAVVIVTDTGTIGDTAQATVNTGICVTMAVFGCIP